MVDLHISFSHLVYLVYSLGICLGIALWFLLIYAPFDSILRPFEERLRWLLAAPLGGVVLQRTKVTPVVGYFIHALGYYVLVVGCNLYVGETLTVICIVVSHVLITFGVFQFGVSNGFAEGFVAWILTTNIYAVLHSTGRVGLANRDTFDLMMGESRLFLPKNSMYINNIQVSLSPITGSYHPTPTSPTPMLYTFTSPPELLPTPLKLSLPKGADYSIFLYSFHGTSFALNPRSTVKVNYLTSRNDTNATVDLCVFLEQRPMDESTIWIRSTLPWSKVTREPVTGNGSFTFSVKDTGLYVFLFGSPGQFPLGYGGYNVNASYDLSSTQYDTATSDSSYPLSPIDLLHVNESRPFVIQTPVLDTDNPSYWKLTLRYEANTGIYFLLIAGVLLWSHTIVSFIEALQPTEPEPLPLLSRIHRRVRGWFHRWFRREPLINEPLLI